MTSNYNASGISMDPYADVKSEMDSDGKTIWGDGINLEPDGFVGGTFEINSQALAAINQIVQSVYDGFRITNATGVPLDSLLALIGLERQSQAYSTATLTLTASLPTTVTAGSIYGTASGINFSTDDELIFTVAGSQDVESTCTIVGEKNASAGEIIQKVSSVYGITAVTNAIAAIPGRDRETDPEARVRHTNAVSTSGDNDAASIYEAVEAVDGVSSVYVDDNDTDGYVGVSVIGGSDEDVATAIASNLTVSIPTVGTTSVDLYNETTRQVKTINFTRATNLPIYITMTITGAVGLYPDDGADQIKAAIVAHFESLEINDNVVYTALYAPIYSVDGVTVNSLYTGISASPTGTSDIIVTTANRATIDIANINITVQ